MYVFLHDDTVIHLIRLWIFISCFGYCCDLHGMAVHKTNLFVYVCMYVCMRVGVYVCTMCFFVRMYDVFMYVCMFIESLLNNIYFNGYFIESSDVACQVATRKSMH